MMNIPLLAAIELLGGEKKTATALGVTPSFITSLKHGTRPIPLARAMQLEELTEGAVKASALRPDHSSLLGCRRCAQDKRALA